MKSGTSHFECFVKYAFSVQLRMHAEKFAPTVVFMWSDQRNWFIYSYILQFQIFIYFCWSDTTYSSSLATIVSCWTFRKSSKTVCFLETDFRCHPQPSSCGDDVGVGRQVSSAEARIAAVCSLTDVCPEVMASGVAVYLGNNISIALLTWWTARDFEESVVVYIQFLIHRENLLHEYGGVILEQ